MGLRRKSIGSVRFRLSFLGVCD